MSQKGQHSDVISFMKMTGERILQTIWGPGNRQRLLQCLYACYKVTKMAFSQCSKYKGNTPKCRILGPDLKGREPRIRGLYERESISKLNTEFGRAKSIERPALGFFPPISLY